ncbi:uncharacterized protein EI97DRAFT_8466 [Westerdykella ornata]|uniref:Uncharacterized protein n=1 Tax=Westerdykella ornata TaxID=318751 RepID=A0A6A6JWK3_WESOR|nr:uncharacterized protein EI97DRAFT_8466 [Westerdykella ornata]KAF2280787.1 hypothetical protein EI97DRAFT_8466 [Westerdykella ornata]
MLPSQRSQPSSISSTESTSPANMLQTFRWPSYQSTYDMVSDERFQHFNTESAKINAGLHMPAGRHVAHDLLPVFSRNWTPVDIDFSTFRVSQHSPSPQKPTAKDIVRSLLCPPPHAFVHGVLSINWVIAVAGATHFECRRSDGRYILKKDSPLRKWGKQLGLPAVYREWLCGDDEERGAAEDGMWLTEEFFEKEL